MNKIYEDDYKRIFQGAILDGNSAAVVSVTVEIQGKSCNVDSACDLMDIIRQAVTDWSQTENGKLFFDCNDGCLNIGDLIFHGIVDHNGIVDTDMIASMARVGIVEFRADHVEISSVWNYHESLVGSHTL